MGSRGRDVIPQTGESVLEKGRFWCHYEALEEYHAGMWRPVRSESKQLILISLAVALLRSPERFQAALCKVLRDWPTSCRAEFTRRGNHCAWLGAAACCITHGVPEDLTRRAWWKLSVAEQLEANAVARAAEERWRSTRG